MGQAQRRIYCTLKNDGIQRFFVDVANKIKFIPNSKHKMFRDIHSRINDQLQTIRSNAWILTYNISGFLSLQENKLNESLKNSQQSEYLMNVFKSKRKVRFLKNFLRGKQCKQCLIKKKKLKICSGCKKDTYCSKRCQKLSWT